MASWQPIPVSIRRERAEVGTCEIGDLVEPEESRDDEEQQLVPHLQAPPPRREQGVNRTSPGTEPRAPESAQRRREGWSDWGGVGSAYGDDGGERQEVRIQHGPHGPRELCSSSARTTSTQLAVMEAR